MMQKPLFRVKHYAHAKYQFLARAKVLGKWQRRYFTTESEAISFAREQNARAEKNTADMLSGFEATQAAIGRQRQAEVAHQAQALQQTAEAAQLQAAHASLEASQTEVTRQAQALREKAAELQIARTRLATLETVVATWQRAFSDLQASFDASQAELGGVTYHLKVKDAQIKTLQNAVTEAHARWTQLTSELSIERSENREHQECAHALGAALQSAIEQARSDSIAQRLRSQDLQAQIKLDADERIRKIEEQTRGKASRLYAVLDLQESNRTGLRRYTAHLERRLEHVSQRLRAAGQALKKGSPEMPGIVDLILEDIRRIHDPSLLWKMAKAFGLLRLAHAGVPRTAEERRALARELKAGLHEICAALSSPTTMPEEAAMEIPRLFQLRRQTRELLRSLKLSSLVLRRSHIWNIVHWARRAASSQSGITPASALFDAAWYLGQNPDVDASEMDPFKHYLSWGGREGRDPNRVFDSAWYLEQNPDVAAAGLNPLKHYWEFGAFEGRDPNPLFSTNWYLTENQDVATSGLNPLQHYLAHGAEEFRDPHPLFNAAWYLSQNPEVSGLNPLEHYLKCGRSHGLSPHPLFDASWYLDKNGDVAAAAAEPLRHYLERGAAEGRDPHPLFDSKWYLAQGANLNGAGQSPLQHYVLTGARERRSSHPMFDARWYAENFPETAGCDDLLTHYLTIGWRRGYRPSRDFDSQAYLEAHPDVAESGVEPLTHFVLNGREEGSVAPRKLPVNHRPDFEIPREPLAVPRPVTSPTSI